MGDLIFVGSCNGVFHAVELKTGRARWETKVSSGATQYFFHGDPFVAGNVIVVGADAATGGNIHAFDAATGKELWRRPAGHGVTGPITGIGYRAYAATSEGQLLSVDVNSGELKWNVPIKMRSFEGPMADGNRVFAGGDDGLLYGLDAETGREVWRVNLGAPVTTSISTSSGDVYAGTADGSVFRVDAQRGAVLGSRKVDPILKPGSMPIPAGDSVLFLLVDQSADYKALVSVSRTLEQARWRAEPKTTWLTSRTFVWGDVIVMGTPSGDVLAYCNSNGALAWSRKVTGPVRSIGGTKDLLVVGTRTGSLVAMRAPRSCTSN